MNIEQVKKMLDVLGENDLHDGIKFSINLETDIQRRELEGLKVVLAYKGFHGYFNTTHRNKHTLTITDKYDGDIGPTWRQARESEEEGGEVPDEERSAVQDHHGEESDDAGES